MARQFNRPYEPELANFSSPNTSSPLSPFPRGETPISFRPNVNRAKTKRWVEAKKYSYDGNDWGEDEWDEYDDPTPPVPQPAPLANQSTGDIPSTLLRNTPRPPATAMDRSRSMEHVATLGVNSGPGSRSQSTERTAGQSSNSAVPIVRPADIYRRMPGQQSGQDTPSGTGHPSEIPTAVGPSATTEAAPKSNMLEREMSGDHLPHQSLSTAADGTPTQERPSETVMTVQHDSSVPGLPDVKRLSGFGTDFLAGSSSSSQKDQTPNPEEGYHLQHNPSLGYRSVVHHAFDVPETPSTTVDSVERSNSGSTSAISPIIGSRAFVSEDKTPTIVEEPESTSPPRDFKIGHRRDLSVPSPGNSPSRQPVITNNDTVYSSALAEVTTNTPADSFGGYSPSHQTDRFSTPGQSPIKEEDRPSPLNINTQQVGEGREKQNVPVIIPSLSTDDSPQDTESDRLRKEIIRSLSRENTPTDDLDQQDRSRPQTSRQDSLIPSEYERYWSEEAASGTQEQYQPVDPAPAPAASSEVYSSIPASSSTEQQGRPKIKRRFSWESSSSDDAPPVTGAQSPPGVTMPGQYPMASPPPVAEEQEEKGPNMGHTPTPEKPKLTIITPSAIDSSSISSDRHLPEVVDAEPMRDVSPHPEAQSPVTDYRTDVPAPTAPPSIESSLLGFRDILGMKTSDERVQAFNRTRDQFASINTGLNHWIQVTVQAHPEHTDVVEQSWSLASAAPKPMASRAKFPKLPSLGTFGASHPDGSPSGSGHVRRPSAPLGSMMNKQQVEQRGKDLLHTAGVLGGKAGEAAKGLFAKGRSKFKGGNEKGFQTTRGYRRNIRRSEFEFSSVVDLTALGHGDERRTVHCGSLPLMKHSRPWNDRDVRFDIKRKGIPNVSASRRDVNTLAGDSPPKATQRQKARGDRPEYLLDLENEMSRALGLDGAFKARQASADVSREFEALTNKHGGADATISLLPRQDDQPQMQMTIGRSDDCRRALVEQSGGAKADSSTLSHSLVLLGGDDQREDGHSFGDFGLQAPALPRGHQYRRGGSAPLQLPLSPPLHRMESISSLGIQHPPDLDPNRPRGALLDRSASFVSLPSDMDPDEVHPQNLGGDEDNKEFEQRRSTGRGFLAPSTPSNDRTFSASAACKQETKGRSAMDKIVGRIRRPSNPAADPGQPSHRGPLDRLSGLFGRHHGRSEQHLQSPPPNATQGPRGHKSMDRLHLSSSQPTTPGYPPQHVSSPGHTRPSSSRDNALFQGQRPPPEGYFAPESFARFRETQDTNIPLAHQISAETIPRHSGSGRSRGSGSAASSLPPNSPRHPPRSPPLHHARPYHPPQSPPQPQYPAHLASPLPSPVPRTPPSRGRSEERTYAQELHLRSRSPKTFAPRPEERHIPSTDITDPAHNLGTFRSSNPRTSRIGDQESPWKLTLPGEDDDDTESGTLASWRRHTTGGAVPTAAAEDDRLPTYEEDSENHPPPAMPVSDEKRASTSQIPGEGGQQQSQYEHPTRGHGRSVNTSGLPVELPVRADDDSSEEITMSSTAYPGQEWKPLGYSGWEG
ncbi:hypothetical protein ATEIFO6365_0001093700 [Aspergillus terreus]|uniref:Uncharacterized protein n=1 Tax=Aspergillus terreus TaxID=33178 RepID=A0A5M3YNT1_ASPTE|nr:hypothetical protein ATETN484_0001085800 [Aspergillus terreus]GFF12713.1 hypothetical protein ATEIFO6365_0001093700 [Aspergillus terreus]